MDRQIDRQTDRQKDRNVDRYMDRQVDRKIDRQLNGFGTYRYDGNENGRGLLLYVREDIPSNLLRIIGD